MDIKPQRPKGRTGAVSSLNVAIEAMNLAKEVSSITPAKAVFGSVSVLLTMLKDSMANELDYVELGLSCADICRALDRGVNGKRLDEFSKSMCDAINQLTTTVAEIQRKAIKQSRRNAVSRLLHAKNDKEVIAAWKSDLNRILQVFSIELSMNIHTIVADTHKNILKFREDADSKNRAGQSSIPGESPPPPPRAHFGRGELIEKIVGLAEHLTPLALIGVGGIGKTSTALTALHNDRIKQRFGDNRRFIRCDQFHASLTHFLRRLSAAIGAGVENPEDLILLRPFLSSKDMLIILDNAESILDPQGTDAQEIYAAVEELSQFDNICLCVTSRISTIPPACESLDIPTLSMEAARDTFYRIYKHGGRSDKVNDILKRLDFHPLSITLLATVSHHNKWDMVRLTREWERRRTNVLQTQYNNSLAATIELSLASPMFQELGPDARDLLGVVAFFPQGVDEDNLDWLFPTIPDRTNIFDNFCILSLTYRSNGFITMLAPLRDYLRPEDPASSPLLRATKEHYITRLSVDLDPNRPGFGEARWIVSEDENVEHLLDVFTSIDANSTDVWDACANFMRHLYWHKPRLSALGPKIERLPDDHPSKPQCLVLLSWTFESVKNRAEYKRLLSHALKLQRQRGDDLQVARTLRYLSDANRLLGLYKEGVRQANEALEIHERHDDTVEQADCLNDLAWLLYGDKQFDASEEAASRAIALLPEKDGRFMVCQCHRILGKIYRSKGEREKAISHFEVALGIASSSNWHDELVGVHCSLAKLFAGEGGFDEAHAHVKKAKSHAVNNPYSPGVAIAANNPYSLGVAMELQARIWYKQCRFEEAKSEVLRAAEVYEKLGATKDVEDCGKLLRDVQRELDDPAASGKTDFNSEGTQ